ncbi:hypothetical protein LSH36_204g02010 [Paralvinella palmiformis]|uniref:Uncharacterized protein n=1 Tax=Paralvinella palmiformis TaxID=53620 RepID=A0AAD9JP42_9ANNE|nr:hypothetical protein LSH36_204g02010 [Paralvinella palmiformis]
MRSTLHNSHCCIYLDNEQKQNDRGPLQIVNIDNQIDGYRIEAETHTHTHTHTHTLISEDQHIHSFRQTNNDQ